MSVEWLSENFARHEFHCKGRSCCGGVGPMDLLFLEALQQMRDRTGTPIIVNSGFRCAVHNRAVGGSTNSQHCKGLAADIRSNSLSPEELARLALEIPLLKGVGLYSTFVHVDRRLEGTWRMGV